MPKPGPDETQANFILPKTLEQRVIDYQFANRLPSKSDAYRALIEKGLGPETEEAPQK